jgi:hypothetical protein
MTRLSEKRDVQDALVNYLIGIGWGYLSPDEIMQNIRLRSSARPPSRRSSKPCCTN